MNGRRQALSYGPMGIVRFPISLSNSVADSDGLWFHSGIRKEHTLVGDTSANIYRHCSYWLSSSSIIKDIESLCAAGLASVAYYYFDFKDTKKQDRRGFLSSLLAQLFPLSHHDYDILSNLHGAHGNGSRQPSEVDLIRCLKEVLASPGRGRVYIIVDAVDESPNRPGIPSPREKVLRLIKELVGLRHPDIRVCITSRPEVDIRRVLEPLASHAVSLHDEGGQRAILSITSSRWLSLMKTCRNGGGRTVNW